MVAVLQLFILPGICFFVLQNGVSADSTVVISGFSHALAFRFRSDNLGPPSLKEVLQDYAALRKLFPGAKVRH